MSFNSDSDKGIASENLARVYQATADETMVPAVAGMTGEEVRKGWGVV